MILEFLEGCSFSKDGILSFAILFLRGLVSFFLYYVLSLVLSSLVKKLLSKIKGDTSAVAELIARSLRLLLISLGIVAAFSEWGFEVRGLLATLGLTGFALGLALKDAVSNIISGVLLVLYAPFRLGSLVSISGKEGKVVKIDIKHTVIEEEGGVSHIIPNSKVLGEVITVIKR